VFSSLSFRAVRTGEGVCEQKGGFLSPRELTASPFRAARTVSKLPSLRAVITGIRRPLDSLSRSEQTPGREDLSILRSMWHNYCPTRGFGSSYCGYRLQDNSRAANTSRSTGDKAATGSQHPKEKDKTEMSASAPLLPARSALKSTRSSSQTAKQTINQEIVLLAFGVERPREI
jgi:hypothetical protein